jgi:hypothetical protein
LYCIIIQDIHGKFKGIEKSNGENKKYSRKEKQAVSQGKPSPPECSSGCTVFVQIIWFDFLTQSHWFLYGRQVWQMLDTISANL